MAAPMDPYLIVNAPNLTDDFYLKLVDWSCQNMLAVVLGNEVYLWSVSEDGNNKAIKLCEEDLFTPPTSVQWSENGETLAVGTFEGDLQFWDVEAQTMTSERKNGHEGRIGCIAWKENVVCTGGRDKRIIQRDIRVPESMKSERELNGHSMEVCSVKWAPDGRSFASGGNDNSLMIWSMHGEDPQYAFKEHQAAVKAMAWSPHHRGLLVTGGGSADKCLRFWDTLTGVPMQRVDTGSQVCDVAWNKNAPELVSTHGFNLNQIKRWKYPVLRPETISSHPHRPLYLSISPDGESTVTGGHDQLLRFYHIFNHSGKSKTGSTQLDLEWGIV